MIVFGSHGYVNVSRAGAVGLTGNFEWVGWILTVLNRDVNELDRVKFSNL